jgi:hypothetical protein
MEREAPEKSYEEKVGSALWGCSDASFPVAVARLEDLIERKFPDRQSSRMVGLTESLAPTRHAFIDKCIAADTGSIIRKPGLGQI